MPELRRHQHNHYQSRDKDLNDQNTDGSIRLVPRKLNRHFGSIERCESADFDVSFCAHS